jgi:hypothetical protein
MKIPIVTSRARFDPRNLAVPKPKGSAHTEIAQPSEDGNPTPIEEEYGSISPLLTLPNLFGRSLNLQGLLVFLPLTEFTDGPQNHGAACHDQKNDPGRAYPSENP